MKKILIIGLGNFGYAILSHLNRINLANQASSSDQSTNAQIEIWGYDRSPEKVSTFKENSLLKNCHFTTDYQAILNNIDYVVIATSSPAFMDVFTYLVENTNPKKLPLYLSLTKALLPNGQTPSQFVTSDFIKKETKFSQLSFSVLSGGTIAADLHKDEIMGATIASPNLATAQIWQNIFQSKNLRIKTSIDIFGTEIAGALKNVTAIATGLMEGLGYNYGTITYLISVLGAECQKLAVTLGAHPTTFSLSAQCWGNDMIMSATGQTRNRNFGINLGEGQSFAAAINTARAQKISIEGAQTLQFLPILAPNLNQTSPLLDCLVDISQDLSKPADFAHILEKT